MTATTGSPQTPLRAAERGAGAAVPPGQPSAAAPKILVIALAGIGDALLATPLIRELRLNFPNATIDALVLWPGSKDLLETNPCLNRVHQRNLFKVSKLDATKFLWSLRRQSYGVSINAHPQSRIHYRFVARIIGAPIRISHEYDCSGWLDRWLVNRALPQDYEKHTIENNLALLALLDARPRLDRHEMEVHLTPSDEEWAEAFLATHGLKGRTKLGIHVGSGGTKNLKLKRWPLTHYVELIQRLNRDRPEVSVLLFGGPEEERDHDTILAQTDSKLVLRTGTQNLRQAGALLKRCDAFLSVDTALMHLAAAVKVPRQIVIEAPTLNRTNVPHGNPFTLVKNTSISGRHLEFYRYDGRSIQGTREELVRCMASVSVDKVSAAINLI